MCITKVESYEFAGKLYTKEIDAVKAALVEIGTRLIKEHAAHPFEGLIALGADISELRARYLDLTEPGRNPTEKAPVKGKKGPALRDGYHAIDCRLVTHGDPCDCGSDLERKP